MQQREDNEAESEKKESVEKEEQQNKQIRDMGQVILNENSNKYKVELLTIIGEVEGHESAPSHSLILWAVTWKLVLPLQR